MKKFLIITACLLALVAAFAQATMKSGLQTVALSTEDRWMLFGSAGLIALSIFLYWRIKRGPRR